jgi:hypothetical protein
MSEKIAVTIDIDKNIKEQADRIKNICVRLLKMSKQENYRPTN